MEHYLIKEFEFDHLQKEMADISEQFHSLAVRMDSQLVDSAEKTAGLRKLLEAKDCAVRAKKNEIQVGGGAELPLE